MLKLHYLCLPVFNMMGIVVALLGASNVNPTSFFFVWNLNYMSLSVPA